MLRTVSLRQKSIKLVLCSGVRFVALFGEKMAGHQKVLQDPCLVRIIKADFADNKSVVADKKV